MAKFFQKGNKYAGNRKGVKMSEEHKKKISESNKGRKMNVGRRWKVKDSSKMGKFWLGKKVPKDILIKRSKMLPRGKDNFLWKGGITPINQKIRTSLEYKLWRKSVFERDNYTCIWCKSKSGSGSAVYLEADHIKPFALYPELRFAIDNGRTLCKDCHKTTNTYGNNIKKYEKQQRQII